MRTLLVIGGDGNMSGMMADRHPDDMKGLLQGLRNCSQYKQIILYPSERFLLPPDNLETLLPLAEFDPDLLEAARRDPPALRSKILKEATVQALALFYETLLSFIHGRHVVLICGQGNEPSQGPLPFFTEAAKEQLETQRIEADKLPLLSGIKAWPVLFNRFTAQIRNMILRRGSREMFEEGMMYAGRSVARGFGGIAFVAMTGWDIYDHRRTVAQNLPVMRKLLSDYFDQLESLVLNDSQCGILQTLERVRRTIAEQYKGS